MRATRSTCFGLILLLVFAGCRTTEAPRDFKPTSARFFLESADGRGMPLVLPQSGVQLLVNPQPVITEADIVNVDLAQVEIGKCLLFQLTPSAARDLYRLTGSRQGRRLVLMIDGAACGARRIDGAWSEGTVLVFPEMAEAALPKLVQDLKASAQQLQRKLAK